MIMGSGPGILNRKRSYGADVNAVIQRFWEIAIRRAGPQDLPASRTLLTAVLGMHWLIGIALAGFSLPGDKALASALIGTLLTVGLVHIGLAIAGLGRRLLQTLTAMAGCEALLGLIALPITAWFHAGTNQAVPELLFLGIIIWSIAVTAHIARHALNTTPLMAAVVAVLYFIFSLSIAGLIGPAIGRT